MYVHMYVCMYMFARIVKPRSNVKYQQQQPTTTNLVAIILRNARGHDHPIFMKR